MKINTTKSLKKALDILQLFLDTRSEIGISEVAQMSGLNITTAYRLASTLVKYNYLRQQEKRGKYSLGTIYLNFAALLKEKFIISNIAAPYVKELSKQLNELAMIVFWDGKGNVITEAFDETSQSNNVLKIAPLESSGMPFHCSPPGKIFLASMSDEELEMYYSKEQKCYTSNTITDINDMKKHLKKVKQKGVAFDDEEHWFGVRGIGAGIKDHQGKTIAAVTLTAPLARMSLDRMQQVSKDVKSCAMKISRELEYK